MGIVFEMDECRLHQSVEKHIEVDSFWLKVSLPGMLH